MDEKSVEHQSEKIVKDDAARNARHGPVAKRNEKEGEGMGERQCRETRRRPGAMGQMGGRNRQGRGTAENNSLDEQARNEETAQGGEDRSGLRAKRQKERMDRDPENDSCRGH